MKSDILMRKTRLKQPLMPAALVLFCMFMLHHSAVAANPYQSDIVSWGSMQMLDGPVKAIAAGENYTVVLKENIFRMVLERCMVRGFL